MNGFIADFHTMGLHLIAGGKKKKVGQTLKKGQGKYSGETSK